MFANFIWAILPLLENTFDVPVPFKGIGGHLFPKLYAVRQATESYQCDIGVEVPIPMNKV